MAVNTVWTNLNVNNLLSCFLNHHLPLKFCLIFVFINNNFTHTSLFDLRTFIMVVAYEKDTLCVSHCVLHKYDNLKKIYHHQYNNFITNKKKKTYENKSTERKREKNVRIWRDFQRLSSVFGLEPVKMHSIKNRF